jgi:MtN3 and saliva related transmembrane protein
MIDKMNVVTVLGFAAALTSTVSFAPQAVKIIRTRDTRSISIGMYGLTVAAFTLWTAYGVIRGEWPLIVSNSICLLLSAFIFAMKLLPDSQKKALADTVSGQN